MLIPSGIKAQVPEGYMLMAAEKSGVVTSKQAAVDAGRTTKPTAYTTVVILGAKIVDEDYQGEIHIHLVNVGNEYVTIKPGTKIAQFILVPVSYQGVEVVPEAELFSETTERGEGGFGLGTGEGSKSDIEPLNNNELNIHRNSRFISQIHLKSLDYKLYKIKF